MSARIFRQACASAGLVCGPGNHRLDNVAAARQHWHGWRFSRREPVVNALTAGQCPDCGAATWPLGAGWTCEDCRVEFALR